MVQDAQERINLECDARVASVAQWYEDKERELRQEGERRAAAARAIRDHQLGSVATLLEGQQQQVIAIRELADEAERLSEMLRASPSGASAASTDAAPAAKRVRRTRPDEHICAITSQIMRDPVMVVPCGHTFERSAIERWLQDNNTCPVCRQPCEQVCPNIVVKKMIDDWW